MSGRRAVLVTLAALAAAAWSRPAVLVAQAACDAAPREATYTVAVPGRPFLALPSADGCHLFVSLNPDAATETRGVAVMRVERGRVHLARVVATPQVPSGMALSHDGHVLVVAHQEGASLFDVARLVAGRDDALIGRLTEKAGAGRVYAAVSPDDRTLFIADERAQTITVADFARARTPEGIASSILGSIPTGDLPIALTVSADGRWLFTTSQRVPAALAAQAAAWPVVCRRQGSLDPRDPPAQVEGAVLVIDLARVRSEAAQSVVKVVRAGCNPVRLVLSPDGTRAYVSARAENALLVFDARALAAPGDTIDALLARVPVGVAPVGIAVSPDGARIFVTNSNRFAGGSDDRQSVTVIDAARVREGASAVLGEIPAGAFPRELRLMPDGRTLVLTNFSSKTVQLVDLDRAPRRR